LVHGSPRDPVWEYLLDLHTAAANFSFFDTQICLVGHTHIPMSFYLPKDSEVVSWQSMEPGQIYKIRSRTILNPGSVGQPRDHDSRAAYAFLDTVKKTWQPMRIAYDIESVQKRIIKADLPRKHAARLLTGW